MNRLTTLLAITGTLLLLAVGSATAFPVNVDDTVYFDRTYGGAGGGGQFDVALNNNHQDYLFGTFCLEKNEHLNLSGGFKVAGISDAAQSGGRGGATDGRDPLSDATKWLYWNFVTGELEGLITGYSYRNTGSANALQLSIWNLEDEISSDEGEVYADWDLARTLMREALAAVNDNPFTEGRVAVMNLTYATGAPAQDQLIAMAPVPEPSTLLLLGSGLAGAALLHRRRKK